MLHTETGRAWDTKSSVWCKGMETILLCVNESKTAMVVDAHIRTG